MGQHAGCTLSHRVHFWNWTNILKWTPGKGMGSKGKYCQERKSLKLLRKFLTTILRGEVLARISFPEKQELSSELAPDLLF